MLDHASEPEPLLDRLLSNPGWTRAIARTLVDDPHLAEDLAQDAALAALRQPPRHDANVGGWLRTVMVRRLRMRRRSERRRSDREELASDAEVRPPDEPADVLERAQAHRAVVDAVLELDEPYRSTLLMRFFDELPPREIARRTGVPIATVRTRLARGLDRLRDRGVDPEGGRAWLSALVFLAADPRPVPAAPLGSATGLGAASLIGVAVSKLVWIAGAGAAGDLISSASTVFSPVDHDHAPGPDGTCAVCGKA